MSYRGYHFYIGSTYSDLYLTGKSNKCYTLTDAFLKEILGVSMDE